jgi:hypothetical protein
MDAVKWPGCPLLHTTYINRPLGKRLKGATSLQYDIFPQPQHCNLQLSNYLNPCQFVRGLWKGLGWRCNETLQCWQRPMAAERVGSVSLGLLLQDITIIITFNSGPERGDSHLYYVQCRSKSMMTVAFD